MNANQAWEIARRLEGVTLYRWTKTGKEGKPFAFKIVDDGISFYREGRKVKSASLSRFEEFYAKYSSGERSPDKFRNRGQKKTRAEVILFLLPVFDEIDRHAVDDGGDTLQSLATGGGESSTSTDRAIKYFFYNTDSRSIISQPSPRFPILINHHFAALGGDREKFGEQFRQLSVGDMLLMYEDGLGVVAIGHVAESWDGKQFRVPRYYNRDEMSRLTGGEFEYRIAVDWFLDLSREPISLNQLRERFGSPAFTPRRAVRLIAKHRSEVESLISDLVQNEPLSRPAVDYAPTTRVESTIYRILRDTALAIRVKEIHEYQCQLCGHTIELPGGRRYAEAHHIKPLGRPHEGPDDTENIVCVCPNHHAELDYGAIKLSLSALNRADGHLVAREFVDYHNRVIFTG